MKIYRTIYLGMVCCLILSPATLFADIKLPAIFGNHMVIQHNTDVPFWGWGDPREKISIKASWLLSDTIVWANQEGEWNLTLNSPDAGGPYEIIFKGKNEIILEDILAGEVWLASGQSNMAMALNRCENAETEIAKAAYYGIRFFHIERTFAQEPQTDCEGIWKKCTAESVEEFSAVAYYFARMIHEKLDVPVGVISASKGGSPAESWLNAESIRSDSSLRSIFQMWEKWEEDYPKTESLYQNEVSAWKLEKEQAFVLHSAFPAAPLVPESVDMISKPHRRPGALYNAMIAPIIPFAIKGVIWYQGENNVSRPLQYESLFNALISQWRREWMIGNFPFYYVQIAPYGYTDYLLQASMLRESQYRVSSIPNTGMVVTTDIGDLTNMHPKNKKDVGGRLAFWALANTYGFEEMEYSGPVFKSMTIDDNSIQLHFAHKGSGLVCKGDSLTDFMIAGSDRIFQSATAIIRNGPVVLSHHMIKNPVALRFAWMINTQPNFYNDEGLPALPFRTDQWDVLNSNMEFP